MLGQVLGQYAIEQRTAPSFTIHVVAIEGVKKTWAAFIGAVPAHWEPVHKDMWVAEAGTKLPWSIAEAVFPEIAKKFNYN